MGILCAQSRFTPGLRQFIVAGDPVIALTHVQVIDGTGSAVRRDQTILIDHGKILTMGAAQSVALPQGAKVMDLSGHTAIPGLIGMHEHLFYPSGGGIPIYNEQGFSFPRLYLAAGVTTARTGGSMETYTDLNIKKSIDAGRMPGPKLYVTGPYLEGQGAFAPQQHELSGVEDARKLVQYWAFEGATSFKAYMHITRAELAATVEEAHKRGLLVTGHLCSVGFREAAAMGIDNLEHGIMVDTEFTPGKQPDVCPAGSESSAALAKLDIESAPVQEMIRDLVSHKVAITSTLAVFEASLPGRPPLQQRLLDAMSPQAAISYLSAKARNAETPNANSVVLLKKEMQFERAFVKAGGLLMTGADPTGNGGALAGFADQRNIELLVEAGFTAAEAIQISTSNAAKFLGESGRIGTLTEGKQADIVVIDGDPSTRISDIEKVQTVFKDGVGYDSAKLLQSVRGSVGLH
ncbi:MAG: amidohydrolase family protein [Bryobacteraceae bacterium]